MVNIADSSERVILPGDRISIARPREIEKLEVFSGEIPWDICPIRPQTGICPIHIIACGPIVNTVINKQESVS